jgi:hypothetical protein
MHPIPVLSSHFPFIFRFVYFVNNVPMLLSGFSGAIREKPLKKATTRDSGSEPEKR